ncbi:MAG TPA: HAMP domain-containing sensor histidine kinase [Labilithrix sp.]|nr:HAMP domain-containing sensor histidine kinase [Labilithrix sp.]
MSEHGIHLEERDVVAKLHARVDELERELRSCRERHLPDDTARFRLSLYEAVLYGLGRTLSLYDPPSVRLLVREMGRRIREYLEEVGYHVGSGRTLKEVFEKTISFFVANGFVDLEVLRWDDDLIHVRWHHLLGLHAYERIVAAGGETFISCPLNAMLHDSLEPFGKELAPEKNEFNLEQEYVESWERIVALPPETERHLSLNVERVLEVEREQSRQLRVRDDFIRIASHELATPVTSMKLALSRLEKSERSDRDASALTILQRQVRRLEHLVTEMLDTTRLQIGRVKLARERVDLVELVRTTIDSLATEGRPVELRGAASVVGMWDAARLEQVVVNLLSNSIKYGEGRLITVDVTEGDGRGRLVVRDQGIGISAEAKKRLFNPFERGVSVEHYGGLGLGLYIARRIVLMHGGTISAESDLGKGATFVVELPLDTDQDGAVLVERPLAGS